MIIVPERQVAALISPAECFVAVENVFASMAKRSAVNFPVIREAIGHADALYGFKSGFDRDSRNGDRTRRRHRGRFLIAAFPNSRFYITGQKVIASS